MRRFNIDIGRVIMVPVFAFFVTTYLITFYNYIIDLYPINSTKILRITHLSLLLCFNVLIIFLYLLRSRAQLSSNSLAANTIAILGTFLPLFLAFLSRPESINPTAVLAGDFFIIAGMAFSVYSVTHLGKNFSIIPQARNLVQSGPYKFVRHPLYLGELISSAGLVLAAVTFSMILYFVCLVICQVYRALQEEKILTNVFPEYHNYRSKTARFLPGIY